ncbi:MAG: hypothetical protein II719_03265 [Clostridia bacterium]|nr:hypothetical protein [Clostridia bacterium]
MRYRAPMLRVVILFFSLLFLLSGCIFRTRTLPAGGFDYRVSSGILLGYPIPREGDNPYVLSPKDEPVAFVYSEQSDSYRELPVDSVRIRIGEDFADVRCVSLDGADVFFSAEQTDSSGTQIRVEEGSFLNSAVILRGSCLFLCSESDSTCISVKADVLWDSYENTLLFSESSDSGVSLLLITPEQAAPWVIAPSVPSVSSAWIARSGSSLLVVYNVSGARYLAAPGYAAVPALSPPGENGYPSEDGTVYDSSAVWGTEFAVFGSGDDLWFFRLSDGYVIPVNMGGLYDIGRGRATAVFPLSPSRLSVYFEDFNCIYRLNLDSSELSLSQNWARVFENTCIISSMTAVTDTRVLLSQASSERTEYEAIITETLFEEDVPRNGEDSETKIDAG